MSLRVCPIATVHAPIQRVWYFLSRPENYVLWWQARTQRIHPEGASQAGQRIHARMMWLGMPWGLDVLVERVDETRHTLDVMTTLPLGIFLFNHIACTELDASNSRISFGSDFSFSPVWWGWVLERYAGQRLYARMATVVSRFKQTVETAS